jgi:hypothetical protein
MKALKRIIKGDFRGGELRRYIACKTAAFWGLILLCWTLFPPQNQFSVMTHSFSYLGSWEPIHNPAWWWVFTVAMVLWGVALVPLVFYIHRRFVHVSRWGAAFAAFLLLAGCLGLVLVGVIPSVHGQLVGNQSWAGIHRDAGLLVAIAFCAGIFAHELLLFHDGFTRKRLGTKGYWRFFWPYLVWWAMAFTALWFLVRWLFVYEDMKRAAAAAGRQLQGSWTEALHTWYSIPMWETVMICTLYVFLLWFVLVIPNEVRVPAGNDSSGTS